MGCHLVADEQRVLRGDVAVASHRDLEPTAHAAPDARAFLRSALAETLPVALLDDVLLLASELVTNVVLHARTALHVDVTHDGEQVLVTVVDTGASDPRPRLRVARDGYLEESGRGMRIIASVADDYGWRRLPGEAGKVTWFVIGIRQPDLREQPIGSP